MIKKVIFFLWRAFTTALYLWALAIFGVPSQASPPSDQEKAPLILGQGEQRLLRIPHLLKYSLGNPIVRILPLVKVFHTKALNSAPSMTSDALLIKGITPGHGDLWVWKKDGTSEHRAIRVKKIIPDEISYNLAKHLESLKETEVILTGKGAVLKGEIGTPSEITALSTLLTRFPKEVHNETRIAPQLLDEFFSQLERWIKRSKYSSQLRIDKIEQDLWLRGSIDNPSDRFAIEKQAKAIYPLIQTEIESMPDHLPTIHFRVFLLELKRSLFQNFGISWPETLIGTFRVSENSPIPSAITNIDLALKQMQGEGNIKILSNPELSVRVPGEAELFAGGEIPIKTKSRFSNNVMWKNFGLTLRLNVTHTAGNRVRLDIFTEVSHLDLKLAHDSIPGIQSNKMKTQVDARFGFPLLLSGLLQRGIREEAKGLPLLRDIPILGALFGSQDYLNEHSELVAILFPSSTPPLASARKFSKILPEGVSPLPRDWISPQEERLLKREENYPWNVLD